MQNYHLLPAMFSLCLAAVTTNSHSQSVAINDDGTIAHASAMLDIKVVSTAKKGVLVPRMTSVERTAIVAPAKGLLVFDNSTSSFWYFNGNIWQSLSTGGPNMWTQNGSLIYNNNAGNVGIGLNNPKTKLHVAAGRNVLFGADTMGLGIKAFWLPSKAAFRAGVVEDVFSQGSPHYWDYSNIGFGSFAVGNSTKASGNSSSALGDLTIASGHASFAAGGISAATATYSSVLGEYNTASGVASFVAGSQCYADGTAASALGINNASIGDGSFSANISNRAEADASGSLGAGNIIRSYGGLAIGTNCDPLLAIPEDLSFTSTSPLFIIGNGTSETRSNALVVQRSGRMGILRNPASTQAQDASLQVRSITGFHALNLESSNGNSRWSFAIPGNLTIYYNNSLRGTFSNTTGGYTSVSDMRFKKDISTLGPVLSLVLQLKTYSYHLIDNKGSDPLSYGFIAQEVEQILPTFVSKIDVSDGKTIYGLNYSQFTVLAIKAIQEQHEMIERLEKVNAEQSKIIDELQRQYIGLNKRIERLENK